GSKSPASRHRGRVGRRSRRPLVVAGGTGAAEKTRTPNPRIKNFAALLFRSYAVIPSVRFSLIQAAVLVPVISVDIQSFAFRLRQGGDRLRPKAERRTIAGR